jgi:hypothetical protein
MPHTSAVVISVYIFLSHHIARHKVRAFIESIPVLHHFGADLRSYIHHVPAMVGRMSELNSVGFFKALVRSLLSAFAREPTSYIVDAVMASIARFPTELFPDLIEFIESNSLDLAKLAFGGPLLRNPKLNPLLTTEQKLALFKLSKQHLTYETPASELEQAVCIISALTTDPDPAVADAARGLTRCMHYSTVARHIWRILAPLIPNFDDLRAPDESLASDVAVCVAAMANFWPDHADAILDICAGYLERRDQVFLAVVELFIAKPAIIRHRPQLMRTVLTARELTWVQQNGVIKLIGVLDQFEFKRAVPGYLRMVLDLTVAAALSRQTVLAQTACGSISQIVGASNGDLLVTRLFKVDWFDPKTIESVVHLLVAVTDQANCSVFRPLVPLVSEALLFFPKESFVPSGFRFLAFFINKKNPTAALPKLRELCKTRIQQHYWSFTQKSLLRTHPVDFQALGPLFSQITTDIISSDNLSTDSVLEPLRLCFEFFSGQSSQAHRELVGPLLPLCPEHSLRLALKSHFDLNKGDVEALIDRTKSPAVLGRCFACFAGKPPDSVRARLEAIGNSGPSAKLAYVVVRSTADFDRAAAAAAAERLLRELPARERDELAARLFPLAELGMRDALLRQFPFLGHEAAPDDALRWFQAHPISQWPLEAPEFAARAFALLARAPGCVPLGDIDGLDLATCFLIFKHKDAFAAADVRRAFGEAGGSEKVTRIRLAQRKGATKTRAFQRPPPPDAATAATAAPLLRRGVVPDAPALLASFLAHSPIAIAQGALDEIVRKCPAMARDARRYAGRCGLRVAEEPPSVDVQSLLARFCVKAKFLERMCRTADGGPQIEIARMLLFQQIAALSSPRKWFFFLRFIRLSLVVDAKKAEGYRRNTREWMKDILAAPIPESEAVAKELSRLLQALFPADALRPYADQYPVLATLLYRAFQEGDYFTEVPSVILDVVAHHAQYPGADVARLLDDRKALALSVPILAAAVIDFLMDNPAALLHPEAYLPALVDPSSALFVAAAPFTARLFSQCAAALPAFEFAVAAIRVGSYSAAAAVPISAAYYSAMARASASPDLARRLQIQGMLQLAELFLLSPTAASCAALAEAIGATLKFFDPVPLLLGRLIAIDSRFVWLLALTERYLAAAGDAQQANLAESIGRARDLLPKSRRIAMLRLAQRKKQEAFAFGLAETDDDAVLDRIQRENRA